MPCVAFCMQFVAEHKLKGQVASLAKGAKKEAVRASMR